LHAFASLAINAKGRGGKRGVGGVARRGG
jgi:hypothetical protein